jgi:hypothetical protein
VRAEIRVDLGARVVASAVAKNVSIAARVPREKGSGNRPQAG